MIKLFHVTKLYGRDNRALDDVSLRLDKGEFAFITGHSALVEHIDALIVR